LPNGDAILDPATDLPTPFRFTGDPVSSSGFIDQEYGCGDRYMNISSGPFTMAPGDSQEVIGAYIIGQGADALRGVSAVKKVAQDAILLYQQNFQLQRHILQPTLPSDYVLAQPYPNPFNETINIGIELPRDCVIQLTICNATGRRVKTLHDGFMKAGIYEYKWNGRNRLNEASASGVYLVRFSAPGVQGSQKILLLR